MTMPDDFADASIHLLRVRSKIVATLEALAARRAPVVAQAPELRSPFETHIVLVDPIGDFVAFSAPAEEAIKSVLVELKRIDLVAQPSDWQVRFEGFDPTSMMHEGAALVRIDFPQVLAVQQRRMEERLDAAPAIAVHCVADAGGITPFDAQITDMSLGGISVLIYPPDVTLAPGTVLIASRIEIAGAEPITVDLEVRYSEPTTLADGRRACRSGFRFVNLAESTRLRLAAVISSN